MKILPLSAQLARVSFKLRLILRLLTRPAKRADNPYATHVPVLIGLARIFELRTIVELGCGNFSTVMFLNSSAFPHLKLLRSFETDPQWMEEIAAKVSQDERANLNFVAQPMFEAVKNVSLENSDLIFIDDSTNTEDRGRTIERIAHYCSQSSSIVIIHDYEIKEYQRAAKKFPYRFTFDALNPNTGVVWGKREIKKHQLRRLNKLIKQHSRHILPDDIKGWLGVFHSNGFNS